MPCDDDAGADIPGHRPPPHPDDRLWRHPSEVGAAAHTEAGSTPSARPAQGGRRWPACLAAAAAGAVLAGGALAALGVGERVVERPVTERVAVPETPPPGGAEALDGAVAGDVAPAVVAVGAGSGTGGPAGSGLVVRDDGVAVTSAALVGGEPRVAVQLEDGSSVEAEVVGTDPVTGLAVVDLSGTGRPTGVLATTADLAPGAGVLVLGAAAAGGAGAAGSAGQVGAYERVVGPGDGALDGLAVAGDAAPGDLGAPVVDARGVVAGVVTHVEEGAAWYVAPVEVVHKVVDDLLTTGEVRHARLGIEGTDATPLAGSPTAPPEGDGGAVVASVVPDSPADHGGLEAGDVVVALDGEPVTRLPDLLVRLRARSPGDTVDVGVRRADGSRATLVITLDELDREG